MEFDLENPLPSSNLATLLSDEPTTTILDPSARQEAATLIRQCEDSLDPMIAYLAVNYVDRFLSVQTIPRGKQWIVRLLAIACLSLACKMRQQSCFRLQEEEGFIFDAETIGRMEMMVLGALGWRMRSITPFAFLQHFLGVFSAAEDVKDRAAIVIFRAQTEVKMMEFRPSVVAAAAVLSAAAEVCSGEFAGVRAAVAASGVVDMEKLLECYEAMGNVVVLDSCGPQLHTLSSCGTPVTVLGAHQSYCSESGLTIAASSANRKGRGTTEAAVHHRC